MNLIRQILLCTLLLCAAGAGLAQTREIVVYLHPDITGSPVMATDTAGNVIWKERYAPYGERQVKADDGRNSLWYTGKSQDPDTGLSYFGARWYDPVLGRFQGLDPSSFNESNPHTLNRYAYANNNPYKFKDPDGNSPLSVLVIEAAKYTGAGTHWAWGPTLSASTWPSGALTGPWRSHRMRRLPEEKRGYWRGLVSVPPRR